ncbi:hypothetical protein JCM8097_007470 [Rhodosporidiobolus ruineniae]
MLRLTARTLPRRTAPALLARSLSSSSPLLLARPPTFTTPEPQLNQQPEQRDPAKPLEPLPPTALPVEDYASPLLHTASFFSSLFRYAVFGSVAIVAVSLSGLVAVHLYVEHSALAPPKLDPTEDDPDGWLEDNEGWSGQHTGDGGTDPRLGLLARAAVRGAWISQHWGGGLVASPTYNPASPSLSSPGATSPFGALARPGGEMIGYKDELASRGTPVNNGGWLLAEQYLVFALKKGADKGISLQDSVNWEEHVEQGGVDRAAVELEERLAGLRERIGGRFKLEAAREGWERIFYALSASPTTEAKTVLGRKQIAWETREKLKATRKLGELSARIAELWREGSDERVVENGKAEGWLVGGLIPVLAQAEGKSLRGKALDSLVPSPVDAAPEPKKHVSPFSSFFGFWSRSHPPATSPSSTNSAASSSSPELAHLLALVPSYTSPSSPATSRAVLSSLIALETFLARRRDSLSSSPSSLQSNLSSAIALQRASLSYLTSISTPAPSSSSAPRQLSKSLSHAFHLTRLSALSAHLAECSVALSSLSSRGKGASKADLAEAKDVLLRAQAAAQVALLALDPSAPVGTLALAAAAAAGDEEDKKALAALPSSAKPDKEVVKAFGEAAKRLRRDAEKVSEIVGGLKGVVEGMQQKK